MIHFWMILSMAVNHPKVEVLYDPLLDDPDHACKSPKVEVLYNPLLDDYASSEIGCFV